MRERSHVTEMANVPAIERVHEPENICAGNMLH